MLIIISEKGRKSNTECKNRALIHWASSRKHASSLDRETAMKNQRSVRETNKSTLKVNRHYTDIDGPPAIFVSHK